MARPDLFTRLRALLHQEARYLLAVQRSDRRWTLPFCAALASGLPLLLGAAFDRLDYGLVASLGGLVFLHTPETPLSHRMVQLMACAFGMTASYTLGLLTHLLPFSLVPMLALIAILVSMLCRYYRLAPPGSMFFIMAAAIAAYAPLPPARLPQQAGLVAMGSLLACVIAFLYSLEALRRHPPRAVAPLPPLDVEFVLVDSLVIGACVGLSLLLAGLLRMERAYWVAVSCLAVIQGASLRAVWNRQLQRILGTALGLGVAWALLRLPLSVWGVALVMMALTFLIETLVVRHYGLAAVFITPLTIFLAEAAHLGQGSPDALIRARFLDTALGALVGLAGGVLLHQPRWRAALGQWLRRLGPLPRP